MFYVGQHYKIKLWLKNVLNIDTNVFTWTIRDFDIN